LTALESMKLGGSEFLLNIFQTTKVNCLPCLFKWIKQSMDQQWSEIFHHINKKVWSHGCITKWIFNDYLSITRFTTLIAIFSSSSTNSVVNSNIDNWPATCGQYKNTRTQIFLTKSVDKLWPLDQSCKECVYTGICYVWYFVTKWRMVLKQMFCFTFLCFL